MGLQNKTNQKFISALLIVAILMPAVLFFIPKKVTAEDNKVSAAACMAVIAKGIISKKVKAGIEAKLGAARAASVSGASGAGFPVTNVPGVANDIGQTAQDTKSGIDQGDTAENTQSQVEFKYAECIEKVVKAMLTTLAKKLLAKMTEGTINWINTGFHGSPLFVESPGSFFKDIAKTEIKDLVNRIGYDSVRFPFGKSTALNIINSYKSTFESNTQYTFSKITNDPALLKAYREDFNVGGWDGFLINTQYPQNNYIGYNMIVENERAARLAGTGGSEAERVKEILQQGQGFLSPQMCPAEINPNFNKSASNIFAGAKGTGCSVREPVNPNCPGKYMPLCKPNQPKCKVDPVANAACEAKYEAEVAAWKKACNTLPGGIGIKKHTNTDKTCVDENGVNRLVNTTPGSVVADQIMTATSSTFRQGELGIAMGNSLSAIFDALLNKLMSSGLNALSNKISKIGTSSGADSGVGGDDLWNTPNQVIVLSAFKKDVRSAIDNGYKELKFIDGNTSVPGVSELVAQPGILQIFDNIRPKAQELDMCLPGPNIGWENRIDADTSTQTSDKKEAFKTWILDKIKIELPGSNSYMAAITSIKTINTQKDELSYRASSLTETLIKLNSINAELVAINTEPNPGSTGESNLIRLKQRYDGLFADLPSVSSVVDVQNKLADAKDKLTNLGTLLTKCTTERTVKGWSNPGGVDSTSNAAGIRAETEKSVFCSSYPSGAPVSCDVVFKTSLEDYKKN